MSIESGNFGEGVTRHAQSVLNDKHPKHYEAFVDVGISHATAYNPLGGLLKPVVREQDRVYGFVHGVEESTDPAKAAGIAKAYIANCDYVPVLDSTDLPLAESNIKLPFDNTQNAIQREIEIENADSMHATGLIIRICDVEGKIMVLTDNVGSGQAFRIPHAWQETGEHIEPLVIEEVTVDGDLLTAPIGHDEYVSTKNIPKQVHKGDMILILSGPVKPQIIEETIFNRIRDVLVESCDKEDFVTKYYQIMEETGADNLVTLVEV